MNLRRALPMLFAASVLRGHRLYFAAAALAALAALGNFDPTRLCYSPPQLASQPTWLSWRQQVARDVPARDLVFSSVSSRRVLAQQTSFRLTQ